MISTILFIVHFEDHLQFLHESRRGLRYFTLSFVGLVCFVLNMLSTAVFTLIHRSIGLSPCRHQAKCDRVILVSSPTHVPRCVRDACSLWHGSSATTAATAEVSSDASRTEQNMGHNNSNNILDHDHNDDATGGETNSQNEEIGAVNSTGEASQIDGPTRSLEHASGGRSGSKDQQQKQEETVYHHRCWGI